MRTYEQLNTQDREKIYLYWHQGKGYREIGRLVGRHHTTIQREVSRNGSIQGGLEERSYSPREAEGQAQERRQRGRKRKMESPGLQRYVIQCLGKQWSPEQIAGRLRTAVPKEAVSYETIYQFIYSKKAHRLHLWDFLPRRHSRRQSLYGRKVKGVGKGHIPHRTWIEERPSEVNQRHTLGHWESDLMEGLRQEKQVLSVTVERKSGYVFVEKLPDKRAHPRTQRWVNWFQRLPRGYARSLTVDNGLENCHHQSFTHQTGCPVYFCHPYHAWEKGTVENTIGLIRRFLPKKTSLRSIDLSDLLSIQSLLNDRPRKRLGFLTPFEVLFKHQTGALHP